MSRDPYFEQQLATAIEPVITELYGGPDPIGAARIAQALWEDGWRRITAQRVEAAMEEVPNLGVEAYEPTITELTDALLKPATDPRRVPESEEGA